MPWLTRVPKTRHIMKNKTLHEKKAYLHGKGKKTYKTLHSISYCLA